MSTSMEEIFDLESEKLDEKFLDLKMELTLNGWSSKLAHKVWDFKRESEEFERFGKMLAAQEKTAEEEPDPSEEQLRLLDKNDGGTEPEYMI